MKYILVCSMAYLALIGSANAQFNNAFDGFQQGMRDGQRAREIENQESALQEQRRANALAQERAFLEDSRRKQDEADRATASEEQTKNERIKLKLEALKMGYELNDDGELKKIEKPGKKRKPAVAIPKADQNSGD